MDNICISDFYVNFRTFRKFVGVCDVTIDYANNIVRVLSVLQCFFLYMYSKLWGSKTDVLLGIYPRKNPNREQGCCPLKNAWYYESAECLNTQQYLGLDK